VEEQESVEVWVAPRTTLAGVRVQVKPAGETELVRTTLPVNPLIPATVMVEVAAAPAFVVTAIGAAVIVKSGGTVTMNVTVAV